MGFIINKRKWCVEYVQSWHNALKRPDGTIALGSTCNSTSTVYIMNGLSGNLLERVLVHEIVHCVMFSYKIVIPTEQEEFMADWIAVHGREVIRSAKNELKEHGELRLFR